MAKPVQCTYWVEAGPDMYIDGTKGSLARFANHSCSNANTILCKWERKGELWLGLQTTRFVKKEEELTWFYNLSVSAEPCSCRSQDCCGIIGRTSMAGFASSRGQKRKRDGEEDGSLARTQTRRRSESDPAASETDTYPGSGSSTEYGTGRETSVVSSQSN